MILIPPEQCRPVWQKMDLYLSKELGVAESVPLESHVEGCPYCAREVAMRRHVRSGLRIAVRSVTPPPFLEARVRFALLHTAQRPQGKRLLAPALAGVLILFGGSMAYELGYLRLTTAGQQHYVDAVSQRVSHLLAVGLRDHIECALFRKYPADAPPAEQLVKSIGAQYRDLLPIVTNHAPKPFRLMMVHRCRSNGRRFLHLALRDGSRTLSLVVTAKVGGESLAEGLVPELQQSGIPIYHGGAESFQIDALETPRHMVYVISGLSARENTELLRAMAPGLHRLFSSVEI